MLDIKRIREDFDGVKKAVESRGKGDFGIDKVREYDVERRKLLAEVEQMKNQQSTSSRQIPVLKKEGKDTTELMAEMKQLSEKIKVLDGQVSEVEAKLRDALLNIPNTPYKDVQEGADDSDERRDFASGANREHLILMRKLTGISEQIWTSWILNALRRSQGRDSLFIKAWVPVWNVQ